MLGQARQLCVRKKSQNLPLNSITRLHKFAGFEDRGIASDSDMFNNENFGSPDLGASQERSRVIVILRNDEAIIVLVA